MNKDPKVFINHILEAISDIEDFSKGITKEELSINKMKQSAILRQIEIIGEAVKNIPNDFRSKYSNVEWKKIAGTRDKMIHDYFGVDLKIVWDTVKEDLPKLKKQIESIIKDYDS